MKRIRDFIEKEGFEIICFGIEKKDTLFVKFRKKVKEDEK